MRLRTFRFSFAFSLICALAPPAAGAAGAAEIALVEDDGTMFKFPGIDPKAVGKAFYKTNPDTYDFLHMFSAKDLGAFSSPHGQPVMNTIQGINVAKIPVIGPPSLYGSAGRLRHAVSMASIAKLPDDPDGVVPLLNVTGIELLAHETGHYWLAAVRYDLGDGQGKREDLRGVNKEHPPDEPLHWSYYFGSGPSVMYGNVLADNRNGTFTLTGSDRRVFSPLDQYLMGLRTADEIPPFYLGVPDPSLTYGSQTLPLSPGKSEVLKGIVREVTIADVLRAEGPRTPEKDPCHLKDAFIIVYEKAKPPTAVQVAKVDAYRTRWEAFYDEATDRRGSVDTTLGGTGPGTATCPSAGAPDGGLFDASHGPDATTGQDAGPIDAGQDGGFDATHDAGAGEDAAPVGDAGGSVDAAARDAGAGGKKPDVSDNGEEAGGCSCAVIVL